MSDGSASRRRDATVCRRQRTDRRHREPGAHQAAVIRAVAVGNDLETIRCEAEDGPAVNCDVTCSSGMYRKVTETERLLESGGDDVRSLCGGGSVSESHLRAASHRRPPSPAWRTDKTAGREPQFAPSRAGAPDPCRDGPIGKQRAIIHELAEGISVISSNFQRQLPPPWLRLNGHFARHITEIIGGFRKIGPHARACSNACPALTNFFFFCCCLTVPYCWVPVGPRDEQPERAFRAARSSPHCVHQQRGRCRSVRHDEHAR